MLTLPPTSSKLLPSGTPKPKARNPAGSLPAGATELFWMAAAIWLETRAEGLIVSKGEGASGLVALKKPILPNWIAFAVVATNEPPTFKLAFGPKIIPFGLSRNTLAEPLARMKPSMLDIDPPVTRLMMF
ncbi:hypothetical protein SAMD00079811_00060 [Scytonema sp. HK-05]|nr:hypothetical protein SAMD00079811_00060 [Scytonema sp. HK-05]